VVPSARDKQVHRAFLFRLRAQGLHRPCVSPAVPWPGPIRTCTAARLPSARREPGGTCETHRLFRRGNRHHPPAIHYGGYASFGRSRTFARDMFCSPNRPFGLSVTGNVTL